MESDWPEGRDEQTKKAEEILDDIRRVWPFDENAVIDIQNFLAEIRSGAVEHYKIFSSFEDCVWMRAMGWGLFSCNREFPRKLIQKRDTSARFISDKYALAWVRDHPEFPVCIRALWKMAQTEYSING